jgi:hypothetical protein
MSSVTEIAREASDTIPLSRRRPSIWHNQVADPALLSGAEAAGSARCQLIIMLFSVTGTASTSGGRIIDPGAQAQ